MSKERLICGIEVLSSGDTYYGMVQLPSGRCMALTDKGFRDAMDVARENPMSEDEILKTREEQKKWSDGVALKMSRRKRICKFLFLKGDSRIAWYLGLAH